MTAEHPAYNIVLASPIHKFSTTSGSDSALLQLDNTTVHN